MSHETQVALAMWALTVGSLVGFFLVLIMDHLSLKVRIGCGAVFMAGIVFGIYWSGQFPPTNPNWDSELWLYIR